MVLQQKKGAPGSRPAYQVPVYQKSLPSSLLIVNRFPRGRVPVIPPARAAGCFYRAIIPRPVLSRPTASISSGAAKTNLHQRCHTRRCLFPEKSMSSSLRFRLRRISLRAATVSISWPLLCPEKDCRANSAGSAVNPDIIVHFSSPVHCLAPIAHDSVL